MNADSALRLADHPQNRALSSSGQRGGIILKLILLFFLLAVVAGLYLFRAPILRSVGGWYVVNESLQPADAIVVLGDDNYFADRAARAAELFHARWAPHVVASGRYLRPYASLTQLMQKDLTDRGVPLSAIVLLPIEATNTREEAIEIRELAKRQHWTRLLVVTSNYHTRRVHFVYARVFDSSIDVRVVAAPDSYFDPDHWWQSRWGAKTLFTESVALVVAFWETRGQQSPPAVSPATPPAPAP